MKLLTVPVFFLISSSSAFAVSFDCSKASTFVEKEICSDPLLGKLDDALSENYKGMLGSNFGGSKNSLKTEQRKWLANRNKCTNNICLIDAYRKRVDETCDYGVVSGVHPECTVSDDIISTALPSQDVQAAGKVKCWRSESYIPSGWCQPTESDYSGDWLSYRKEVPIPFHASGDFNGDANKDEAWILYDENRKKWAVFIFLKQDDKKYIPIKIREIKFSDLPPQTTQINAIDPGDHETACGKGYWECSKGEAAKIALKMNGLVEGPYEKGGSSLIYWKNGKFEKVMLDD